MIEDGLKLLENYGWAAFFIVVTATLLFKYLGNRISVWNLRDKERITQKENILQDELSSHQFFADLTFKLDSEIPTLTFEGNVTPVRQKLFRNLLSLKLISLEGVVLTIVNTNMEDMTSSQWASFIQGEMQRCEKNMEELAKDDGIPSILISKFMVWQVKTSDLLNSYINDLAISPVYTTNLARTNTLLYLLDLKLTTIIGDAERSLIELNGEISGLSYKGESIE